MLTSETPSCRSVVRSRISHSRACSAERMSGSVTISTSGVPQRLKSTQLRSEPWIRPLWPRWVELGRVLLQVDAVDAHVAEPASAAQRHVVLGDLVALGVVRIEVVLAVKQRAVGDLAAERQADHHAELDRALIGHRQGSGETQADGAGVDVRRIAERQLAAAEHLRSRLQLDVDLKPDHRLVVGSAALTLALRVRSKPIACSSA